MLEWIFRRIACLTIALGIGVLFMPSSAVANMRLELATGSASSGYTGTVLTDSANTGQVVFYGSVGVFGVNVTAGTSSPPLTPPPGDIAQLDLSSLNISTTNAGTMTIILENSGYGSAGSVLGGIGAIGGTISNGTLTATSWVGATNGVPNLPTDQGVGALSAPPTLPSAGGVQDLSFSSNQSSFSSTQSASFTNLGQFSLYTELVITFGTGGGSFSADLSNSVIPEPSGFVLAGLGALGLICYGLRRRKAEGA